MADDSRLIDELSRLFDSDAKVRGLLSDARIPYDHMVPFGPPLTPHAYWREVVVQLELGKVDGGRERLVEAAAAAYPGNRALRGLPEPRYPDDVTRTDSEALETLYRTRAARKRRREDTSAVQQEILELKRKMRGYEIAAGEILGDGRYTLLERLGQGGFAEVWLAYDEQTRDDVALKVLHGQHSHDRSRRERFLRGARKMQGLEHSAVVRVLGEPPKLEKLEPGAYCFFAMEYLPGGDLRKAVKTAALDRDAALKAVLAVGEALAHAHGKGLIHRDVKPENILLTVDGLAKLTDFDLVRAADTTGGTRTQAMGSFAFAAPEMMMDAKTADVRADVYGLAMTAAFVLHGGDLPAEICQTGATRAVRSERARRPPNALSPQGLGGVMSPSNSMNVPSGSWNATMPVGESGPEQQGAISETKGTPCAFRRSTSPSRSSV